MTPGRSVRHPEERMPLLWRIARPFPVETEKGKEEDALASVAGAE